MIKFLARFLSPEMSEQFLAYWELKTVGMDLFT